MLAGLYRTAQVGVVTPLHDGMNLVAKEYVAAQNPADPGVLVLSKFAGAANELDTALLVNPHDIDGMARTIAMALSMPLTERRMRYEAMMEKLREPRHPAMVRRFRRRVAGERGRQGRCRPPLVAEVPTLWPPRTAQSRRAVSTENQLAVRDAVEDGAARLVRRVRIVQRHRCPCPGRRRRPGLS